MKFLITWKWDAKNGKEVTERFKKWNPKGKYKMLYPVSTIIGANAGFAVMNCDDIAEWYKDTRPFTDIITYKTVPIMDAVDAIKVNE